MASEKRRPKARRRKGRKPPPDRYDLYQRSVQEPECEVEFFDRVYRSYNKRTPRLLREDFCGTFAICCEWVKKKGRLAIGVDLDPEPLAWGRRHNLARLPEAAQARVTLLERDVRDVIDEKADVVAAENFSYWIFRTREELGAYFRAARANLAPDGIFVLDLMGGGECLVEDHKDVRKCEGFRYEWEHARFDPITHECTFYIHFKPKGGRRLRRAFEYHWRFWTIPEVREVLAEAGFSSSAVYWEGTDPKTGEGDGEFRKRGSAEADPSWIAYVVARR